MRILICCEFYSPSIGGVQEVMRQLAERLVVRGHEVTVATTDLPERVSDRLNGVTIKGFNVSGNFARGMTGQVDKYRRFVQTQDVDLVLIKAAQQWTFDALWPTLPAVRAGKVFIPCGFSNLYDPAYRQYFALLPEMLRQFDHLIFYASNYRDIAFAKQHGVTNFSIIPNGASEVEFAAERDGSFRQRQGVGPKGFLFLTVGRLSSAKGHLDLVRAFLAADFSGRSATLIINGNVGSNEGSVMPYSILDRACGKAKEYGCVVREVYREQGLLPVARHAGHGLLNKMGIRRGRYQVPPMPRTPSFQEELSRAIKAVHTKGRGKRVLLTDLPRPELIQAYLHADLFVFASHVEYSPLVLFESAAAGTPFLSVPVGNAEEIASWTGGGVICSAHTDERGYTRVDPTVFGRYWSRLAADRLRLEQLGATGRQKWAEQFTWHKIASQYEQIFDELLVAP